MNTSDTPFCDSEARAELAKLKAGPDNELRKTVLLRDYSEIIAHLQRCQDKEDVTMGDMGHNLFAQAIRAIEDLDALVIDLTTYRPPNDYSPPPSAIQSGEPLWCADCHAYHAIGVHTVAPSDAPTPETDEHIKTTNPIHYVRTDFARRLERERDEARKALQIEKKVSGHLLDERNQARALIQKLETELESHAWEISPAMAQAKIDQLNAQLDEARAELAKLSDPVAVHINMLRGTIATPTREHMEHVWGTPPPTDGSAVEWVQKNIHYPEGDSFGALYEDKALELARRADEAERHFRHQSEQLADEQNQFGLLKGELHQARAQLAAAQAKEGQR